MGDWNFLDSLMFEELNGLFVHMKKPYEYNALFWKQSALLNAQENIHNFLFVFIFLAVCYNGIIRKPHLPMASYLGKHN